MSFVQIESFPGSKANALAYAFDRVLNPLSLVKKKEEKKKTIIIKKKDKKKKKPKNQHGVFNLPEMSMYLKRK